MADFNFTVDTDPMAREIKSVSHHVDAVSGSVIAMQTAVIKAERDGADLVCSNVNRGFYSLMQSQISQKIAALTSQVEAKLIDMSQQAVSLSMIQKRMERDYHMISNRYGKLFNSLNSSLAKQIEEVDKPVMRLIRGDMVITDSRVKRSVGIISTNQNESILDAQLIMTSKIKSDGAYAIESIHQYIRDVNIQKKQSDAVIDDVKVDNQGEIYIPISICESTTEMGVSTTRFHAPTSNLESIDEAINCSVQQITIDAVRSGKWGTMQPKRRKILDSEFSTILLESGVDERVKKEIMRLYSATKDIKQLKKSVL